MSARDLFGLVVRLIGFGLVLAGVVDLGHLLLLQLGLPTASHYSSELTATSAGFYLLLGVAVLASAGFVVRVVYGRESIGR